MTDAEERRDLRTEILLGAALVEGIERFKWEIMCAAEKAHARHVEAKSYTAMMEQRAEYYQAVADMLRAQRENKN